jgi:choline dehydrogenase
VLVGLDNVLAPLGTHVGGLWREVSRMDDQDQPAGAGYAGGEHDVIVCGAGSAGSTLAGLLAAGQDLRVLLLEAGPDDVDERVCDPDRWIENLGTERDWGYITQPGARIDNRRLLYSMGRGLGGGSSINVGVWSRGHRRDWEDFAGT